MKRSVHRYAVLTSVVCAGLLAGAWAEDELSAPATNAASTSGAQVAVDACSSALFCDGFEDDATGQLPGAPWSEETYGSGAQIAISGERAYSGKHSMQISAPRGARRRGYVAIHRPPVFPAARDGMYGRMMVWLDAEPVPLAGAGPVHWTLLQGEGRSADDRYNAIYRLGAQLQSGLGLQANYETTPPVRTDCRQHSARQLPTDRWACVEWHFDRETNELQFWLDGTPLDDIHVVGRGAAADSHCANQDLQGQWLAPPAFQSLYIGLERYDATANDQNLWVDEVVISRHRVACPAGFP